MADYTKLHSIADLDTVLEASGQRPVLVFKHSLTCPVSSAALREYDAFVAQRPEDDTTDYHLIEIQKHRDVSNAVAERSGVRHESPQAVLFRSGEPQWNASHWSITVDSLQKAVG